MSSKKTHIIVLGNEKGGAGKTTTAVHIITSLLYKGFSVNSIDIDSRQLSLTHYLENRQAYAQKNNIELPNPTHHVINKSRLDSELESNEDEKRRFVDCLEHNKKDCDFIIIDCPGSDTYLSRLAHSYADTVVTPINDSFVDLNVLACIDDNTNKVERHGVYSEMVWEAKIYRAQRDKGEIDWVVLRNRLTNIDAKNKRNVADALNNFANRVRCRVAEGFSERVIYRELFLKGLTLLDITNEKTNVSMNISHVAARQELRGFMEFLNVEGKAQNNKDNNMVKQSAAA